MVANALPQTQTEYFPLTGGLDQVTPALALRPGMVRDGMNFECTTTGGYARIQGFERFDGRPAPSEQGYWTLQGVISGVTVGQTITGATSGATGVLAMIDTSTVPGKTYIVLTKLTGSFNAAGENLKVSGLVKGSCTGPEARAGAATALADVTYKKAAADIYRADIQKVPGSGQILGVWMFNDVTYAFRNSADGSAALMYKATTSGWSLVTTPTLLPGGKYEFVTANFGGSAAMLKMFGCDGVNKGFMFDGTTFTQITTGMPSDRPNHVEYHKNFLWFAFDASLQHSAIGDPTSWTAVLGAGEIALGEKITSLKSYIGSTTNSGSASTATDALLIHTQSKTQVLYGSSNDDFSLSKHSDTSGAVAGSVQVADQPYYVSDLGVTNMSVTGAYGNFIQSSLSQTINPFIIQEKPRITCSCIVRGKSQYRLFFNDGYALYVTFMNGKIIGMMIQQFGMPVRTVCSLKKADNTEWLFFGSDDGYVYQLDKGPNFDGGTIQAYINLVFASFKTPRVRKRWRKAVLDVSGGGYLQYSVSADLAWLNPDIAATRPTLMTQALSSATWDQFTWDQFFWDGVNNSPAEIPLDGTGENMGLRLQCTSDLFEAFNVASAIVHYTMRRQLR